MKNICGPIENDRCPVTGLTILSKPEWTNVSFGKDYKGTACLLGDSIVVLQGSGYANLQALKDSLIFTDKVLAEGVPEGQDFILLEDLSKIRGISLDARKYFIDYVKKQERLRDLIFYGVSPLFKLSISLGKRLNIVNFNVEIADNYGSAVKCAQKVLLQSQNKSESFPINTNFPFHHTSDGKTPPQKIISQPDWSYQSDGFSMRCEIFYEKVVHIMSTGKFKEEDVDPIYSVLENVARKLSFSTHPCYVVLCLQESKGTKQKARISYYKATKQLYQKYPFKMTILYGVNRFLKAAINFNRHFMPIKVRITDDLDDALVLVNKDKPESENSKLRSTEKHPEITSHHPDKIDHYVNELLQFIEKINWEKDDIEQNTNIDPAHPFARVFDAMSLVKWELDDLISERTRTGEELKQAKEKAERANLAKSEFLANMSHELRTPLNHIIGFTELVVDKTFGDLNKVQEEYLNDVHHSSKHLLSLINDILDLSKVETGKQELELTEVNLQEILENSLIMIKEKAMNHGIQLSTDIGGIPEIIRADERKLKQVMYNLLSNAVKFTPDGGKIHLTADLADGLSLTGLSQSKVESEENLTDLGNETRVSKKFVRICVTDNGIGIKQEDLERIFNPFEQGENSASRKYQGTGLGLSLTKSFVELHGGKIWAESEGEGRGSRFSFILPTKNTTKPLMEIGRTEF